MSTTLAIIAAIAIAVTAWYLSSMEKIDIRFSKKNSTKELVVENFMDWGGTAINIVILDNNTVVSEMKFKDGANSSDISNKVLALFR